MNNDDTGWRVVGSLAYRWVGRYERGAMRQLRATKRAEAELRNEITPPERRRASRRPAR